MLSKTQYERLIDRDNYIGSSELHQNDLAMRKKLKKCLEEIPDLLLILKHLPHRQLNTILDTKHLQEIYELSEIVSKLLNPPQIRLRDEHGRFESVVGTKFFYLDPPEENSVLIREENSDGTQKETKIDTFGVSASWELSPEEYKLVSTIVHHIEDLQNQIIHTRETLPDTGMLKFQGEVIPKLKEKHNKGFSARMDHLLAMGETDLEAMIVFFQNFKKDLIGLHPHKPVSYNCYDRSKWTGHIIVKNPREEYRSCRIDIYEWDANHDRVGNNIWSGSFTVEPNEIPLDIELDKYGNIGELLAHDGNRNKGIITVSPDKEDGLDFPSVLINKDGTQDPFIRID